MAGTKRPSMTSMWMYSAPARSHSSSCSREAREVSGDDGGGELDGVGHEPAFSRSRACLSASATRHGAVPPGTSRASSDDVDVDAEDVFVEERGEAAVVFERESRSVACARILRSGRGLRPPGGRRGRGRPCGRGSRRDRWRECSRPTAAPASVAASNVSAGSIAANTSSVGEEGVDGVEEGLLVLLEVAVVGEREALEGRQDRHQVAVDAACAAAGQLGDVGVALLGHDAGAGGEVVGQADEAEFVAGPEDDLLGEAREVHHRRGRGGLELDDEVAVGDGVDAVAADAAEAELAGDELAVERVGDAGEGAGAERQLVGAASGSRESARRRGPASRSRRAGGGRGGRAGRAGGACSRA